MAIRDGGVTGLVEGIMAGALAWRKDRSLDADRIGVDRPGFDDALRAAQPRLLAALGDGLATFLDDLKEEAMYLDFVGLNAAGAPLVCEAHLFAVPLMGPPRAIDATLRDAERFDRLVTSFKRQGLAHPDSTVVLLKGTIAPSAMAAAGPGAIRATATVLRDALLSCERDPEALQEAAGQVFALLGGEAIADEPTPFDPFSTLGQRAVIGMRLLSAPSEKAGDDTFRDYFTSFHTEEERAAEDAGEEPLPPEARFPDEKDEVDLWVDAVNAMLSPHQILIDAPAPWMEATYRLALGRMQGILDAERLHLGIPYEAVADRAHIHLPLVDTPSDLGPEHLIIVAFEYGGHLVGPIDVPAALVSAEADGFVEEVDLTARETVHHAAPGSVLALRGHHGGSARLH